MENMLIETEIKFDYGYTTIIPYIIVITALVSVIVSIIKHNKKNITLSLVVGVLGVVVYRIGQVKAKGSTPMLGAGPANIVIQYDFVPIMLFIISIIIQLIPLIICLRKNKNVKKDEVKQ